MSFLKNLLSPKPAQPAGPGAETPPSAADNSPALQSQLQALRLDLAARDEQIAHLTAEVERLRARQDVLASERSAAQLESLMSELASPVAQLTTQADLLENQGKPVQARDVLAIARRLIRALERHGLALSGAPGQEAPFDPALHQPINAGVNPQPGQPVTIRFAGVMYGGKMLVKAIVE
jgi:molecular chaperone GrpE (heat shock protein)